MSKGLDERFVSHKLIFDGKVAKGYAVDVRMDDGHIVRRDYFHYGPAAVILPVLDDGSIVLIRNFRFAVDEHLLELPAGMVDGDEDPAACAARELTEETGYSAARIEKLGAFFSAPGTTDETMHAFLATDLTAGDQDLEVYEKITLEMYPENDVRRMVADGRIHDAKTIAALGLYWLTRAKE